MNIAHSQCSPLPLGVLHSRDTALHGFSRDFLQRVYRQCHNCRIRLLCLSMTVAEVKTLEYMEVSAIDHKVRYLGGPCNEKLIVIYDCHFISTRSLCQD